MLPRKRLATEGRQLAEETLKLANQTRDRLNQIEGIYCVGSEILGSKAAYSYDPTKLIISVKSLGLTGHDVEKWLRESFNIEVELSDLYNILCIFTPGDSQNDADRLVEALTEIAQQMSEQDVTHQQTEVLLPAIPLLAMTPRDAFYANTEVIPLKESSGRIIAEFVMVYPPGIPIFIPGEIITEENISYIFKNLDAGLPVQGPEDSTLHMIRVIKEQKAIQ